MAKHRSTTTDAQNAAAVAKYCAQRVAESVPSTGTYQSAIADAIAAALSDSDAVTVALSGADAEPVAHALDTD